MYNLKITDDSGKVVIDEQIESIIGCFGTNTSLDGKQLDGKVIVLGSFSIYTLVTMSDKINNFVRKELREKSGENIGKLLDRIREQTEDVEV